MLARFLFMWYAVVRVRAFLEYMVKHSSNFGRAPDSSGDRLCNQTRTLSWISRVAGEIVFQHLQSDTDALLDQPCCQGDCTPAFAIRQGRSLGSAALPGRLFSSMCNQTRTLSCISRVAGEIVFQPLQSDTDALLDQPRCRGDCFSSICNQTRTLYWISRVAREIVLQPLQSDKDALLDQPRCQGDCFPASAIRQGRSLGSAVSPGRLYSSLCNQTRTLCWISRVAGEIVFQPLQSDTDARCTKRVRCSYFSLVARGQTESGISWSISSWTR